MRPILCIGLLLICMNLTLDYSSSVLISGNGLIHSEFCKQYRNMDEQAVIAYIESEIDDSEFGNRLCPVIGKELYGEDAVCKFYIYIRMIVASSTPEQDPFDIHGKICRCYDRMGTVLAEFCIRRAEVKETNVAYVLRPRGQQTDLLINYDTVLYADALHYSE